MAIRLLFVGVDCGHFDFARNWPRLDQPIEQVAVDFVRQAIGFAAQEFGDGLRIRSHRVEVCVFVLRFGGRIEMVAIQVDRYQLDR